MLNRGRNGLRHSSEGEDSQRSRRAPMCTDDVCSEVGSTDDVCSEFGSTGDVCFEVGSTDGGGRTGRKSILMIPGRPLSSRYKPKPGIPKMRFDPPSWPGNRTTGQMERSSWEDDTIDDGSGGGRRSPIRHLSRGRAFPEAGTRFDHPPQPGNCSMGGDPWQKGRAPLSSSKGKSTDDGGRVGGRTVLMIPPRPISSIYKPKPGASKKWFDPPTWPENNTTGWAYGGGRMGRDGPISGALKIGENGRVDSVTSQPGYHCGDGGFSSATLHPTHELRTSSSEEDSDIEDASGSS